MSMVERPAQEHVDGIEGHLADISSAPPAWSRRAQELAWQAIRDTLAIGVAARGEEQTRIARASLGLAPAAPEDVLLTEPGLPPLDGAFVAGVMTHALDWDDYMHPMHGHCSSVLLAATWPLLAEEGRGAAGLLDAFLVGYQVDYLVSLVMSHGHYYSGWHATSTVGTVGAAAAAARVLGLDRTRAAHALGMAASAAAGLRENFGTMTKAVHAGNAARAGVHAALLARAGAEASSSWLLGPRGMARVMQGDHGDEEGTRLVLEAVQGGVHGIETAWGLAQKPYSCCGSCHAVVDALLAVVEEEEIAAGDIARIELHVDPVVPTVMPEPAPSDPYAARYCLPWVGAAAAADRALGPAQFTEHALARPDLAALLSRVVVVPDLETTAADRYAGRAVVLTSTGRHERTVRHALGHPANPMTPERQAVKVADALRFALPAESAARTEALVADLPSLDRLPH